MQVTQCTGRHYDPRAGRRRHYRQREAVERIDVWRRRRWRGRRRWRWRMEGNGCRYGRWWGRRGLLLAGTAVLGFRLGLGLWCALRHIDDDLNRVVRVVCFCGMTGRGHATSLFAWVSRRCVYIASFPPSAWRYTRCYRRVIVIPARGRLGTRMRARAFRRRRDDNLHASAVAQRFRACVPPQSSRAAAGHGWHLSLR